jgi:hypothetical protein
MYQFSAQDLNIDKVLCNVHLCESVDDIALTIIQVSVQPTLPMLDHKWNEFSQSAEVYLVYVRLSIFNPYTCHPPTLLHFHNSAFPILLHPQL